VRGMVAYLRTKPLAHFGVYRPTAPDRRLVLL